MDPKPFLVAFLAIGLLGCQPPKPQQAEVSCNQMLASCAERELAEGGFYLHPVNTEYEELEYRIAELRRWLAWQRAVQLGLSTQPFETDSDLLSLSLREDIELNLSLSPADRQLLLQSWDQPLIAQE